ncbi:MAG: tetratricopeptide repeat protein [Candidatus Nanopelagicales bacterium]
MRSRAFAWILVVVVGVYLLLLGQLALRFITTGEVVGILLGVAILAFPLLGAWVLWREMRFGYRMQELAAEWQQFGIDPADLTYEDTLARVEDHPDDWARWFELGLAYEQAGDRKRARAAMREAGERYPERT